MSVRQKEPEPDGNGRGEQLNQVDPQAPFAAQDTASWRRRPSGPDAGGTCRESVCDVLMPPPGQAAAAPVAPRPSFPTLAGASDPERHPQWMRKTRKTRCRGGGPPGRAIIHLG